MNLTSSAMQLLGATGVFIVGVVISMRIARIFDTSNRRSLALYLWHTAFCLVYVYYVSVNSGDAIAYYRYSLSGDVEFALGTEAVEYLTSWFSAGMGLSLLGVFLVFNIFGFVGLLAFDGSLQNAVAMKAAKVRHLATLILLLPSVSFWSSAIGKDALSFMAAGLCLWAAQDLRRRPWFMVVAVGAMVLVRPHVAALMIVAIAASMALERRVSMVQRAIIGAVAVGIALQVVPVALDYSGLGESNDTESVAEFVELRQGYNMTGGGSIDISEMPLPTKMFTYFFRPLPWEAHNLPALAASIDNVILLFLVILGASHGVRNWQLEKPGNRTLLWIYTISAWVSLAMTTSNLGISVRQKWMFAPMLILLFITMIGRSRRRASGSLPVESTPVVRG